ncbi:uncharacterized protein LOC117103110 isoform X3 [Anneissia japonica]|uniref:uncharacterized protein LOC117103110 isoform X3 n=1 Tax=Anneissia japonica TaxID=1529436 RepID=UPI00142555ED|nr:uncharacterized protein LOC117103110 isoform X3 [Anneissia japonica]
MTNLCNSRTYERHRRERHRKMLSTKPCAIKLYTQQRAYVSCALIPVIPHTHGLQNKMHQGIPPLNCEYDNRKCSKIHKKRSDSVMEKLIQFYMVAAPRNSVF